VRYSIFVWRGTGRYGGHEVAGGVHGQDELLVTHDRAVRPISTLGQRLRNHGRRLRQVR
jgi:hypothetical protein